MQCFPVLFTTKDYVRPFKDQIIDLKGEYLKKNIIWGCQVNGGKPINEEHEFLGDLPATAVWSYKMEQFQRSDIKILNTGKYLVDRILFKPIGSKVFNW